MKETAPGYRDAEVIKDHFRAYSPEEARESIDTKNLLCWHLSESESYKAEVWIRNTNVRWGQQSHTEWVSYGEEDISSVS